MKKSIKMAAVLLIGALLLPQVVWAAPSGQTIKANMKKRMPEIIRLLKSGTVGENAAGFLAIRGELSAADKAVVEAENADRKTVYEAIARKEKTTADLVGKRRAKQIFERVRPGIWIQDESGAWKQK